MNKPAKILAIRNELRVALGESGSSIEILECARLILNRLDDEAIRNGAIVRDMEIDEERSKMRRQLLPGCAGKC
ncbi:MAG: hypothetical protein RKH07_01995 [Gammaproteobacteria bacterium]